MPRHRSIFSRIRRGHSGGVKQASLTRHHPPAPGKPPPGSPGGGLDLPRFGSRRLDPRSKGFPFALERRTGLSETAVLVLVQHLVVGLLHECSTYQGRGG